MKLFSRKKGNFDFRDAKNKAVFTCNHVLDEKKPILYVSHDSNGDWQFLCGQNDHTEENAKIIALVQAVEIDNSLNQLFEMPIGVIGLQIEIGGKWEFFKKTKKD